MKKMIEIPCRPRGRASKQTNIMYHNKLQIFADRLKEIQETIPSKISARGWCYILEGMNAIDKSQFDRVEKSINECRKCGLLPIDFTAYDNAREFANVESLTEYTETPEDFLISHLKYFLECYEFKDDIAFWETQEYFIQMLVEKIDIKNLFLETCKKYHIPIANARGWSDINSRANLIERFKEAEELGLKPVLLYFGDFDPDGLRISEKLRKNLDDLSKATGWTTDNLIIERFGLNYDFIEGNKLTWINNLITGSGKPINKNLDYVKRYIEKYGERKCEANACLVKRNESIKLCEETILKYLGDNPLEKYNKSIQKEQEKVKKLMNESGLSKIIKEFIEKLENVSDDD